MISALAISFSCGRDSYRAAPSSPQAQTDGGIRNNGDNNEKPKNPNIEIKCDTIYQRVFIPVEKPGDILLRDSEGHMPIAFNYSTGLIKRPDNVPYIAIYKVESSVHFQPATRLRVMLDFDGKISAFFTDGKAFLRSGTYEAPNSQFSPVGSVVIEDIRKETPYENITIVRLSCKSNCYAIAADLDGLRSCETRPLIYVFHRPQVEINPLYASDPIVNKFEKIKGILGSCTLTVNALRYYIDTKNDWEPGKDRWKEICP